MFDAHESKKDLAIFVVLMLRDMSWFKLVENLQVPLNYCSVHLIFTIESYLKLLVKQVQLLIC